MKKKITHNRASVTFTLILISMTFFSLCSCKQKETPTIRIIYLTIWADNLNEEFHRICEDWGIENDVPIEVEDVPLRDLSLKLAIFMEAGKGADLAVFPSHLAIIHHRQLADVTELVIEFSKELGETYSVAAAMNTVDDKWVGVPLFAWSHIWVYRQDLLDEKELSIPETWEEAADVAINLTDTSRGIWGLGIGLGKDDDAAMFFQALLWSFGGKVFAKDGKTVLLDSPETRSAVEWLLNLYRNGIIPQGAIGWDGASNNRNFLGGKIAITANSPTIYYVAKRENLELAENIVHSTYPMGPAGIFSYATGFSLAYLKNIQNKEEVNSLLKHIFTKENYQKLIKAGKGSVNPLYKKIDALSLWDNDERLEPALNSLEIEKPVGWPGPVTPVAAEVFERRILTDMFARIINDGISVDEAVSEASNRVKEIVERYE